MEHLSEVVCHEFGQYESKKVSQTEEKKLFALFSEKVPKTEKNWVYARFSGGRYTKHIKNRVKQGAGHLSQHV